MSENFQVQNTSRTAKDHKIYPDLLRGLRVVQPNQVWCADFMVLPIWQAFLYLDAIMDWYTRRVRA